MGKAMLTILTAAVLLELGIIAAEIGCRLWMLARLVSGPRAPAR
jgi:hypothetical protein